MTASGGGVRLGGGGIEQKGKRTHGHGQQCGDCWKERGIRRLNGNGKNTVKVLKSHTHKKEAHRLEEPHSFHASLFQNSAYLGSRS